VAQCRAGVGLARMPAPRLLELRGAPGDLRRIAVPAGAWWQAQSPHRALLLGDGDVHPGPDVAVVDRSDACAGLILAGPGAARLAATVPDALMACGEGDFHRVLVVAVDDARPTWDALLHAGAAAVEPAATELHRAAQRTIAAQRPS